MGEMVGRKRAPGETRPHESPLVPNRTMQRMYEGIVQSRLLEEYLRRRYKKAGFASSRGQEACRVSTVVELGRAELEPAGAGPVDLVSDAASSLTTTGLLLGAELDSVIEHAAPMASGKKRHAAGLGPGLGAGLGAGLLPEVHDPERRLDVSLGAALALKHSGPSLKQGAPSRMVVVFMELGAVKNSVWKKTLHFAGREELPMLFVVLPRPEADWEEGAGAAMFELSERATAAGVPGIPVDAADAIALYRVAQESIGRARSGGGPALMACTHFSVGQRKRKRERDGKRAEIADPMSVLGQVLLDREICDKAWLAEVAAKFKGRLAGLRRAAAAS